MAIAALGLSFAACQQEEPDLFDASNNGVYFDDKNNQDLMVDLNFATRIIKPIDTLAFDVEISLLGHLSGTERRVKIVGDSIPGKLVPVFDTLPKEVVFAPFEYTKTVTLKAARPHLEDVLYGTTLRIVPINSDLGDGIEGKEKFTVYVSTIYQKPELWDDSSISIFYGEWTKEKHIYLAKCYGEDYFYDTEVVKEADMIYVYPHVLADLRAYDSINVEVPYHYDDEPSYNQVPDYWTELHNEYIADYEANPWYAGKTFVQIAESAGLTTKTDSLWFTGDEARMQEINQYGVELMQDVYDQLFSTIRGGGSYFSTANYHMFYDVPLKQGISYNLRQPNCWSDDGPYAKACKPLIEKYYGPYSKEKLDFMVNTLLELKPDYAKFYLMFPVSCTYIQESDEFVPRYDQDHETGTGEEIMLELNEIFRSADLENTFNFPTITE